MSSSKANTKSRVVVLPLPADLLARFPHEPSSSSKTSDSKTSSSPDTPQPPIIEPTPADTPAESSTPAGSTSNGLLAPPAAGPGSKRKGAAGPRPPAKRSAAAVDGTPKARGKPGPKKKQRMGDMINDPNSKGPFATAPMQKLGPKASMGAINAGLRALDRTGKPCRKWEKKGFQIRSFTGVVWDVATWRAPRKAAVFAEDVKSDTTGSSDPKVKDESSAISEKSGLNGDASTPAPPTLNGIASSPIPVPAAS